MENVYGARVTPPPLDAQVSGLAAVQRGIFSRAQVARLGVSNRMIQHRLTVGRWEQLARDVFRLAGAPQSWLQSLVVACLAWGDGAVISHRAAAALWRLAGFVAGVVELTVPRGRRRKGPGITHRNAIAAVDTTAVEAIPVTTPARTLIDVASVAPRDTVEEALDDALRRGLVTLPRLRWRVEELAGKGGRPGISVIRSLLVAHEGHCVSQSLLETKVLRLMTRAGLPEPVAQHRVRDGGRVVAVVDFAYPDLKLAIEADGYRWHSGRAHWHHDRARRNRLTLLGWRVVHVTWEDLERDPRTVVASVEAALGVTDRFGPRPEPAR